MEYFWCVGLMDALSLWSIHVIPNFSVSFISLSFIVTSSTNVTESIASGFCWFLGVAATSKSSLQNMYKTKYIGEQHALINFLPKLTSYKNIISLVFWLVNFIQYVWIWPFLHYLEMSSTSSISERSFCFVLISAMLTIYFVVQSKDVLHT